VSDANGDRIPEWIVGAWERAALVIAGEPVSEIGRAVWIQTEHAYVDLRAPGQVASGTSFAGHGTWDGRVFTWHHEIDMHPRSGAVDRGALERDGDDLVEAGEDLDGSGPYVECWRPLSDPHDRTETVVTPGGLAVRVGAHAAFARDDRDLGGEFSARYRRHVSATWRDEIVIGEPDWQPF
jgi:hypothetical protein